MRSGFIFAGDVRLIGYSSGRHEEQEVHSTGLVSSIISLPVAILQKGLIESENEK